MIVGTGGPADDRIFAAYGQWRMQMQIAGLVVGSMSIIGAAFATEVGLLHSHSCGPRKVCSCLAMAPTGHDWDLLPSVRM